MHRDYMYFPIAVGLVLLIMGTVDMAQSGAFHVTSTMLAGLLLLFAVFVGWRYGRN